MVPSPKLILSDERQLDIPIDHLEYEIKLTNNEKQTVSFSAGEKEPDKAKLTFHSPIGRIVFDSNIQFSDRVFEQTASFDYSFFRYNPNSPTNLVLPPQTDQICLHISRTDQQSWSVDELTLFDDHA